MTSDYNIAWFAKYSVWGCSVAIGLWMLSVTFPDEASALLVVVISAGIAIALFRHYTQEKDFVTTLFLGALVVRLAFGMFVHAFDLRDFFGGDALTYHAHGSVIADYWSGLVSARDSIYQWATLRTRPGWGMNYVVAAIYYIAGKNILAAQSFCAVIGAATAPMVYFCAKKLFLNSG